MGYKMEPDHQVAGLYKRATAKGDKWVVSGRVKGGNPTKVTIGFCAVFSAKQARTIAKQHLAAMAQGINPNQSQRTLAVKGKTLGEALDQYIYEKNHLIKQTTIKSYQGTIQRNFLGWMAKPINSITAQDCVTRYNQIRNEVAKRSRTKQKANAPGEAEAQKAMRTLGAVLGYFANDMLPDNSGKLLPNGNPVDGLKDKRIRKKLNTRTRALLFEERTELLDFLTHPSNFVDKYGLPIKETQKTAIKIDHCDWLIFLLCTGLRFNEPLGLTWDSVDFEDNVFTVINTKNNKPLTLPMTKRIRSILLRRKNNEQRLSHFVFPQQGNPKKSATMNRVCERISRLSGIDFTAHDLRRTTATALRELGYSIEDIGRILNHSRSSITDEYIQTSTEQLRKALEELEYMLFDVMWDEKNVSA
jgi:integrase